MAIDTDRLVQIANELKGLDERRQKLLAELHHIAGGGAPAARQRGRLPGSRFRASAQADAVVVRRGPGRPPGSRNQAKAVVAPAPGRKRRKGLTTDIMGLLADGNAYTAGDIVGKLGLSPKKSKIATVGATLSRLMKEGRVKKDAKRGYRAA